MTTPRRNPRQPWLLGAAHRLATCLPLEHLDDLVRLVLLTGPNERLHRPGFGAGLGQSTLFEPLSPDLAGVVSARARGSLTDVLGDRLDVVEVTVTVADSTLSALIVYRPKPSGQTRTVTLTLPAAAL
jgi:phage baseplate assembly protein W